MSAVNLVGGSVVRVGSQNRDAVLSIQAAVGITADGNFGPATKLAVEAIPDVTNIAVKASATDGVADALNDPTRPKVIAAATP